MLKRCDKTYKADLLTYARQEKEMNLFIIGDIEIYGFDCDFQHIYVDKKENKIVTIYLIFHQNLLIYSDKNFVDFEYVDTLLKEYSIIQIMGKVEMVKQIMDKYPNLFTKKEFHFSALKDDLSLRINPDMKVELATVDQSKEIVDLLNISFSAEEASYPYEMIENRIKSKEGRHYFYRKDGKIVAQANSAAETADACLIGGVATLPEQRKNGYATAIVSQLCSDLLKENKTPCLFYDNPDAAKIYLSIGFKEIGYWGSLFKVK